MNFVFYVMIFYIQEYSTFENYQVSDHKYEGLSKHTGFKPKNADVQTANLKLNVFDKMLSEEMLSIKQHFYARDSSHTPSVRISVQGIAATPTLEVKQKWPIENLFLKSWTTSNTSEALMNGEITPISQNFTMNGTSIYNDNDIHSRKEYNKEIKDKVLELRSLPETRAMRICDCMKTNPEPTCSHRCTGMDFSKGTNICQHVTNEVNHKCTRTSPSTTSSFITFSIYPMYVTYPSYFWGLSTYTENPYYHPNPVDEIKISKTKKKRKTKKPRPYVEESYREVVQSNNEKYYNNVENYINSIENYDEDLNNFSKHKSPTISNKATSEYEDKFEKKRPEKLDFIHKDSFVNDIVEDLKEYYGDILIKDCYCSLSSHNYILNIVLLYSVIFAYSLIYIY